MDNKNNTRIHNTGHHNTGHHNTGHYNTGECNTGHFNTGHFNTGECNTGDCNTGDRNQGRRNTGHYNTGRYNTGDRNTGDHNTGHYNTGECNTGDCNTTTPTVRLFNKDSGLPFDGIRHSKFRDIIGKHTGPVTKWVISDVMTDEEKRDNPSYLTTGGFLNVNKCIRNTRPLAPEDREFLVSLPNFDAAILKECTGIAVGEEKVKITIGDKSMWISKESAEAIKSQL